PHDPVPAVPAVLLVLEFKNRSNVRVDQRRRVIGGVLLVLEFKNRSNPPIAYNRIQRIACWLSCAVLQVNTAATAALVARTITISLARIPATRARDAPIFTSVSISG